jgi:hypothetical protein
MAKQTNRAVERAVDWVINIDVNGAVLQSVFWTIRGAPSNIIRNMHKIMPQIVNRAVENDVNPPGLQDFLREVEGWKSDD